MSILLLVDGILDTSSAQVQAQEQQQQQYNVNSLGISFKHPDNWKIHMIQVKITTVNLHV